MFPKFKSSSNPNDGCGVGCFRPSWLKQFATPTTFMAVFGLLGTVQAMSYVYFVSTLTTMERRFGIPSKTTGYMLSGNEISQILLSLILSYAGGQRNRPVWLAWGVMTSALSCFILTLPHMLYGPGEQAYSLTTEYATSHVTNQTSIDLKAQMGICSDTHSGKECDQKDYSIVPPLLVFVSQFVLGIGTTLYMSLGQPYMDDNTEKSNTPMLLGIIMALRTIGPAFGFLLGFVCLSFYVDPSLTPLIDKKDARWVGAWWIGWIILGTAMLSVAVLVAMFPKSLPKRRKGQLGEPKNLEMDVVVKKPPPSMKEFPVALKRLLKNKLLMTNIFSGAFYILGGSGYITYMTKYIEIQFEKSAANANVVVGPVTLVAMVFGFLISGSVLSKRKPKATYVLGWNAVVGVAFVLGEIIMTFISCENTTLVGYNPNAKSVDFINSCNVNCGCENLKYAPVCLVEKSLTFYSACHAGCRKIVKNSDGKNSFDDCACVPGLDNSTISLPFSTPLEIHQYTAHGEALADGACHSNCGNSFILLIVVTCIIHFLGSSGKIGNILVNYRAVSPDDKSFAQGLALLLLSLLAFIPGPIIFGYIIDSTCIIWDGSCGDKGNCWFYDRKTFRYKLNLISAAFTTVGMLLDVAVWYLGRDLKLYDEDEPEQSAREQQPSSRK